MPEDRPETIPLVPTEATDGTLLLQVPPGVPSVKLIVELTQTLLLLPTIETGVRLTVIMVFAIHPVGSVKVMVVVPGERPVTSPDTDPTVPTVVLLLLHAPLPEPSERVTVAPWHINPAPAAIADGNPLTVTLVVIRQPVGKVKVTISVPDPTPFTIPLEEPIVATPGVPLVHVPVPLPSVKVVFCPTQTFNVPPIVAGMGLTVNGVVMIQPVGKV